MKNTLDDRYVRVDDYVARSEGVDFPPQVRAVFAQLDQPKTPLEVASALKLSLDDAQSAFRRLSRGKLIRPQVEGEAPASTPTPAAVKAAAPVAATPKAVPAPPAALAPVVPPAPAPSVQPVVFLRLASERAAKIAPAPAVSLRLSNQPAADGGDSAPPWRLRPILDAINAKAGGGIPGQLLVYKVFLQLPPDLLKAAGVESLNAVNDKVVVTDPRLRAALAAAARQHANLDAAVLGVS